MHKSLSKTVSAVKDIWSTIWRSVIFITIWGIVVSIVFSISNTPSVLAHHAASLRLYNELIPLLGVIAATWFMTKYFNLDRVRVRYNNSKESWVIGTCVGLTWICLAAGTVWALQVMGIISHSPVTSPLVWILALLLNTIMQELLVRGYLFSLVRARHGLIAATLVTTLIFVGLHGPDLGAYGLNVINVVTASIVFTMLLVYTEGLLAPIIAHFIWNLVGGILLGVVVLADDYPSYAHTFLKGSSVLNGDSAKLEGSVVVFLVNSVLIAILYILYRRKQTNEQQ